jgi:hypothetical protein
MVLATHREQACSQLGTMWLRMARVYCCCTWFRCLCSECCTLTARMHSTQLLVCVCMSREGDGAGARIQSLEEDLAREHEVCVCVCMRACHLFHGLNSCIHLLDNAQIAHVKAGRITVQLLMQPEQSEEAEPCWCSKGRRVLLMRYRVSRHYTTHEWTTGS